MTRIAEVVAAGEALKERVGPAIDAIEENVRQTRRAIVKARHEAEDLASEASLRVRRHPLAAVAAAAGAGLATGYLIGFLLGWRAHGNPTR